MNGNQNKLKRIAPQDAEFTGLENGTGKHTVTTALGSEMENQLKFCSHCGETAHTVCRASRACKCRLNKPSIDTHLDRGDAVNLARNYVDGLYPNGLTAKGILVLARAVLRMDEVLRK